MLNQVPQAPQTLAQTQSPILDNFATIDTVFAVDHATFNTTNAGFHNKITMPQQNPAPTGIAGMGLIYYFTDNNFYLNINNGTPIPFTQAVKAASGYTYLPSGMIIQWGRGPAIPDNQPLAGAPFVTFPLMFPNACYSVSITPSQGTNGNRPPQMWTNGPNQTGFSVASANGASGNTSSLYYIAIGF